MRSIAWMCDSASVDEVDDVDVEPACEPVELVEDPVVDGVAPVVELVPLVELIEPVEPELAESFPPAEA